MESFLKSLKKAPKDEYASSDVLIHQFAYSAFRANPEVIKISEARKMLVWATSRISDDQMRSNIKKWLAKMK